MPGLPKNRISEGFQGPETEISPRQARVYGGRTGVSDRLKSGHTGAVVYGTGHDARSKVIHRGWRFTDKPGLRRNRNSGALAQRAPRKEGHGADCSGRGGQHAIGGGVMGACGRHSPRALRCPESPAAPPAASVMGDVDSGILRSSICIVRTS